MTDETHGRPPEPDADAGAGDDGFVIESHSAMDVSEPHPDDTTVHPQNELDIAAAAAAEAEPVKGAQGEGEGEGETEPAKAAGAAAPVAVEKGKGGKRKGPTLDQRAATLKQQVDELTYQKHQTQRDTDEALRKLGELRQELARVEAKRGAAPAAEPEKPAVPGAVAVARPDFPDYRKYATDDEYDAAVATYRKDDAAWVQAQIEASVGKAREDLTKGFDARRTDERVAAEVEQAQRETATRLRAFQAEHPDWQEKTAATDGLRSRWYDPAKFGRAQTPFLSDLLVNHPGDGAGVGYFVGELMESDPDAAQRIADLLPYAHVRDAFLHVPSAIPLLQHFATPDGAREFEALNRMHPQAAFVALGALHARLTAAPSGSAEVPRRPITSAVPTARPPVGSPGANGSGAAPAEPSTFYDWHVQEDARELKEKLRRAGLSPS